MCSLICSDYGISFICSYIHYSTQSFNILLINSSYSICPSLSGAAVLINSSTSLSSNVSPRFNNAVLISSVLINPLLSLSNTLNA